MIPYARPAIVAVLLLLCSSAVPVAQHTSPLARPRLVVVIGVDQFRTDYIDKFEHQWTRGLRRLLDQGAWFSEAAYPYARTVTCAGHATIATGTFPWKHGIINNAWWDRDAGEQLPCTADPSAPAVAYAAHASPSGESAHRLLMPTLADELRAQSSHPVKVVSLSMKARSAIMLAGQRADLVAWYQGADGWMSSSAHGARGRVPFLERYVAEHPVNRELNQIWERVLPTASYLYEDDGVGEAPPHGGSAMFPHSLKAETREASYGRWESSPLADTYLGRTAVAAVESFGLGKGPDTDFLGVSFSGLDRVGHAFGPRSHEVQDTLVRLDTTLAELFDTLDRLVGRDHYVVALTADHGVAPVPEQMTARGLDAGRLQMKEVVKQAEAALTRVLGPGSWIEHFLSGELYLTAEARKRLDQMPHGWKDVVAAIEQVPGVARVFHTDEVLRGEYADDPLARLVRRSLYAGRNGELNLVPKPYWIISGSGSTHGSANDYDRRVPVLLMGPAVASGRYFAAASPADVAPTLAVLAGVTLADPDGRVLSEALQPAVQTPGGRTRETSPPVSPGSPKGASARRRGPQRGSRAGVARPSLNRR